MITTSIHSFIHPSIQLSIYSSIYPPIHPSIHSAIHPSINPITHPLPVRTGPQVSHTVLDPFVRAPPHLVIYVNGDVGYNDDSDDSFDGDFDN